MNDLPKPPPKPPETPPRSERIARGKSFFQRFRETFERLAK